MICTLFNEKMLNCCEIIMKDCDAELLKNILIYQRFLVYVLRAIIQSRFGKTFRNRESYFNSKL